MNSPNLAIDYATSLAKTIRENTEAGTPFGYDESRTEYGENAEISAFDYLEDVLDIQYIIGSDLNYRSGRITITYGGPNAYIDTHLRELIVHWGMDVARKHLPTEFVEQLDEALAEYYEMVR